MKGLRGEKQNLEKDTTVNRELVELLYNRSDVLLREFW